MEGGGEGQEGQMARVPEIRKPLRRRGKDRPNVDVIQLLKNHPDMKDLPMEQWDAI
jgi:hypothetical protein